MTDKELVQLENNKNGQKNKKRMQYGQEKKTLDEPCFLVHIQCCFVP